MWVFEVNNRESRGKFASKCDRVLPMSVNSIYFEMKAYPN